MIRGVSRLGNKLEAKAYAAWEGAVRECEQRLRSELARSSLGKQPTNPDPTNRKATTSKPSNKKLS